MAGVQVGKRVIGGDRPVSVGWENVPRVEGGRAKVLFFSWFQPVVMFALLGFWYYAPNDIAVASTAIGIGLAFKVFLLGLEWVNPRFKSWQLTWKELVTDLFYVGMGYTVLRMVGGYVSSDVLVKAVQASFDWDKFSWFTGMPLLVQAFLISFIFDFGQYWMHRGMHNWHPLWLTHAPHHYITQLNINKGAVGNPIELILIGFGIGGFFDFLPRAALLAGALGMAIGSYQHINVRFNTPRLWRWLFYTTEHHSGSNYAGTYVFIDRMFGTCVDGEAELLGMEDGRRMSIRETMIYPFTEGWKSIKERLGRMPAAVPAE
jgi:sterol desaturase/sphingolipid hydroxylase (fatty acid hydroxylase superfamily)